MGKKWKTNKTSKAVGSNNPTYIVAGVSEEERQNGALEIFAEMMAENTPRAIKYIKLQIKETALQNQGWPLTLINLIHISNITICLATVIALGMGT